MKKDLLSSIGIAIAGALIAFFVCNLFLGPIEDVTVKQISTSVDASLVDPNPEVFNYEALNPTVEVYVGDCTEFDSYGVCQDELSNSSENNNWRNQ